MYDLEKGLSASNLALKWEIPYVIKEAYDNGYFLISKPNCATN